MEHATLVLAFSEKRDEIQERTHLLAPGQCSPLVSLPFYFAYVSR